MNERLNDTAKVFSKRGMELVTEWHKEKLTYMYEHDVFTSLDFETMDKAQLDKFYMEFMDKHATHERTLCGAEINAQFPTGEQFWKWYDSPTRIINQLRTEEAQKNDRQ